MHRLVKLRLGQERCRNKMIDIIDIVSTVSTWISLCKVIRELVNTVLCIISYEYPHQYLFYFVYSGTCRDTPLAVMGAVYIPPTPTTSQFFADRQGTEPTPSCDLSPSSNYHAPQSIDSLRNSEVWILTYSLKPR